MRIQIDALGHTWHLNITAGIHCPAEPDRDTQLDSLVETDRDTQLDSLVETVGNQPDRRAELDHRNERVGNQPDRRAELDHRVRPDQTLGFR